MKKSIIAILLISIAIIGFALLRTNYYKQQTLNIKPLNNKSVSNKALIPDKEEIKNTALITHNESRNHPQQLSTKQESLESKLKDRATLEFSRVQKNSLYYPNSPFDTYMKHIQAANNGNYESQYFIYKIIYDCNLNAHNRKIIFKQKPRKNDPKAIYKKTYEKLITDYCHPLNEKLNLKAGTLERIEQSLSNAGHPIFAMNNLSSKSPKIGYPPSLTEQLENKKIMLDALKTDPIASYYAISRYLRKNHPYLEIEIEAWNMLGCEHRKRITPCQDPDKNPFIKNRGFTLNEIKQIISLSEQYQNLIENNDWERIFTSF